MTTLDDDFDLDPLALVGGNPGGRAGTISSTVGAGAASGLPRVGATPREREEREDGGSSDVLGGPLVPRGGAFDGQVAIVGPTRIEGSVRGSIRGNGDLTVGPGARIEGRVECDALDSQGEIVGPVRARTRARFSAGARLDGDLEVPVMVFEDDAILNGRATIRGGDRLTAEGTAARPERSSAGGNPAGSD